MTLPKEPMRLEQSDLFSPRVESYLEERAALKRAMPDVEPQPLFIRIIYSGYFYLSLAAMLGAIVGWGLLEPFYEERGHRDGSAASALVGLLFFPTVAGFVGMFLGAIEGIMCRNPLRALTSAAVGLGVGFGGAFVLVFPASFLFGVMGSVAASFMNPDAVRVTGMALLILMMGRAAAWAIVAIPSGLGQGIAVREKKVIMNGVLGAVLGGLLGGLLFDPIGLTTDVERATVSRGVGFAVIGMMVGLFVGLVEQWTKTAWLLMRAGPLAGKQFVIYKNPTVLGSSPKADVYLFKDDAIEPRHALIHNRGGRFELEDCGTPDGTYVNGIPVKSQILRVGDQIVLGKTVLEFSLRETR